MGRAHRDRFAGLFGARRGNEETETDLFFRVGRSKGPEMVDVVSSNLEAVGYDKVHEQMYVRFRNGETYIYDNVPLEVYETVLCAPSAGSYLNREVRNNYRYHRVPRELLAA